MKQYSYTIFFLVLAISLYKIGGWEFKTNYDIYNHYARKGYFKGLYFDKQFEVEMKLKKPIYIDSSHYMIKFNNKHVGFVNNHTFFKSSVLEFILLVAAAFFFEISINTLFEGESEDDKDP
jgi:hypothetical protein